MFSVIVSGKADLADALFLVAVILFGIVTVVRVFASDVEGALKAAGLALVSLAWLVL